jgi:hypothetical protein
VRGVCCTRSALHRSPLISKCSYIWLCRCARRVSLVRCDSIKPNAAFLNRLVKSTHRTNKRIAEEVRLRESLGCRAWKPLNSSSVVGAAVTASSSSSSSVAAAGGRRCCTCSRKGVHQDDVLW